MLEVRPLSGHVRSHERILWIDYAIAILILIWAVWFIISMTLYIRSGQYDTDKRLREICK